MKIYNLNESFNLVLRGKLRNNLSGLEYSRKVPFADFPIQINISVTKSDDSFLTEEQKWQNRVDIEALEPTYLLRLQKSYLTAELEESVAKMSRMIQVPILIEDSPNQLVPGREITEWTVQ